MSMHAKRAGASHTDGGVLCSCCCVETTPPLNRLGQLIAPPANGELHLTYSIHTNDGGYTDTDGSADEHEGG